MGENQATICPHYLELFQFIESLDRTTLTVSDDEFEKNVELAVSAIAEQNREIEVRNSRPQGFTEKSSLAQPELTPRNSLDTSSYSPGKRPEGSSGQLQLGR